MNILNTPLDLVQVATQHFERPPEPVTTLTSEQAAIVEHSMQPGQLAKVIAYAGTGKTSTFVAYARARPNEQLTYLAFNKSVETDGKRRFGHNTLVKTVHALAYNVVGRRYSNIAGSIQNWVIAKAVRAPLYESTLIARTIETWLNSADPCVDLKHVEPDRLERCKPGYESGIIDAVKAVWQAVQAGSNGFEMTHSGYLKLYQLSDPTIPGTTILLDEAQDTNPVTQALVLGQLRKGKSVLMCGDPYQQIYAWRGAVDAMQQHDCTTFRLTQSWRFSQRVADLANTILRTFFNEQVPLRGLPTTAGEVPTLARGTTITRTNSEIFSRCVVLALKGQPFHVVGKEAFYQMLDQLTDVFFLYAGKRTNVMDRRISRHATFGDLVEFAETTLDVELASRCRCVDTYRDQLPVIIGKIRELYHREPSPDMPAFVTCHKAKGLEWDHVTIAEDFTDLYNPEGKLLAVGPSELDLKKDEVNLLYVAATRAKKTVQLNTTLQRLCTNATT